MKQIWSERHGGWVDGGGYAKTEYDNLPLPGGKQVADLNTSQLAQLLIGAGVVEASHHKGRHDNLAALAKHLEAIRKAAADKAVSDWVAGK